MQRVVGWAAFALWIVAGALFSQQPAPPPAPIDPNVWICPMDPDVRSHDPGTCPRCGMKLATGLPEPVEYHMDLSTSPRLLRPGKTAALTFDIHDPWKDRPVTKFQVVHERLFHMFVVSQDLEFFLHDHPVFAPDGKFHYDNLVLPKAGMYRVLGDFYPDASTPQLIARTLIVPGTPPAPVSLTADLSPKETPGMHVELKTVPEHPVAGMNTQLRFTLSSTDPASPLRLEQYLGTWGHMLVASDDLIDLLHTHPFIADGGPEVQFNVVFPRPGRRYRVWVQFQRQGMVSTSHFDVGAEELH